DGIRDFHVTGVQTCALPISSIHDGDGAHGLSIVIARSEATKQSTLTSLRDGLLRSARNDGIKCNLAPLAGRGPRRSAAKYRGEEIGRASCRERVWIVGGGGV